MKLSIIIVGYNTKDCVLDCLNSVFNINHNVDLEVFVVDNASSDNSEEVITSKFPQVNWINMGYNAGFSRANNAGIKSATGEFVMLLNPDTVVKEGFFEKLITFYEQNDSKKLGLLGCRIKTINGEELLVGSKRGFPSIKKQILVNPIFFKINNFLKVIKPAEYNPNVMHLKNHEVDYLSGACLLIQKEKLIHNDLLMDEDFFLYSEDVDWSYRIQKAGFRNFFYSEVEVYHINSGSTDTLKEGKFLQIMLSRMLLIYKCYGATYFLLYCWLVRFNNLTRKIFNKLGLAVVDNRDHDLMYRVIKEKFRLVWKQYVRKSNNTKYLKYD